MKSLLDQYRINIAGLSPMSRRVVIVSPPEGNPSGNAGPPKLYLMTNSKNLSARYQANFDSVSGLDIASYLAVLGVGKKVGFDTSGRITMAWDNPGAAGEPGVQEITESDMMFALAAVESDHPEFNQHSEVFKDLRVLLQGDGRQAGKRLVRELQEDAETFVCFLPLFPGLIDALSWLLSRAAITIGARGHGSGRPLPAGLARAVYRHLFDTRSSEPFRARPEEVDFSGPIWAPVGSDPDNLRAFEAVLTAFCDVLRTGAANQHNGYRIDQGTLGIAAVKAVSEDVAKQFQQARKAKARMRDSMRSAPRRALMLEWVLDQYRTPDRLAGIPDDGFHEAQQDDRIVQLILNGQDGVAPPIIRPSRAERLTLRRDLEVGSKQLLGVLLRPGHRTKEKIDALPPSLARLAQDLLSNPAQLGAIDQLAATLKNGGAGDAMFDALSATVQMLMTDYLFPELFRAPDVTREELDSLFLANMTAAYLIGSLLGSIGQKDLGAAAKSIAAPLGGFIDPTTSAIVRKDAFIAALLDGVVGQILLNPKVVHVLMTDLPVVPGALRLDRTREGRREFGPFRSYTPGGKRPEQHTSSDETPAEHPARIDAIILNESRGLVDSRYARTRADDTENQADSKAKKENNDPPNGRKKKQGRTADEAEANGHAATNGQAESKNGVDPLQAAIEVTLLDLSPEPPTQGASPAWREQIAVKVAEKAGSRAEVRKFVASRQELTQKAYSLAFGAFAANRSNLSLRQPVIRAATLGVLLEHDDQDLGLGGAGSNLLRLLVDLVSVDVDDMEGSFISRTSLLSIFEEEQLVDGGFTEIRNVLRWQGSQSLVLMADLASHLCTVRYFLDGLRRDGGVFEVIVFAGTADQYRRWLEEDNLQPVSDDPQAVGGRGRLRLGQLVKSQGNSDSVIHPAVAVLTDRSFRGTTKEVWLKSFAALKLRDEETGLAFIPPPICLSTDATGGVALRDEVRTLAPLVASSPTSGVLLGPRVPLNAPGSAFPTYLGPELLFALSFLAPAIEQRVLKRANGVAREPGFQPFSEGGLGLSASMEGLVWGVPESRVPGRPARTDVAFAALHYLYTLELLLGTAAYSGARSPLKPAEFFRHVVLNDSVKQLADFRSSEALNTVVLGGRARRFALEQDPSATPLKAVRVGWNEPDELHLPKLDYFHFVNVEFFNRSLTNLHLIPQPVSEPVEESRR